MTTSTMSNPIANAIANPIGNPISNPVPRYTALSRHIDALLRADERLIAAFWDDARPASVNLENIAYWLGQSAEAADAGVEPTESR